MHTRTLLLIFVVLVFQGCATLPDNSLREHEPALVSDWAKSNFLPLMEEYHDHPGMTGVYPLSDGLDAFAARAGIINLATTSLDVQYYLFHDDLTGRLITYLLYRAAERGVWVRILVDDMGMAGRDMAVKELASHPNIQVRYFNPFSRNTGRIIQLATRFGSVTRRMHNKSLTADNAVSIVGGRNIGDEYFSANPVIEFGDLDVLLAGAVVPEISASFNEYWNSRLSYSVESLVPAEVTDVPAKFASWENAIEEAIPKQEYIVRLQDSEIAQAIGDNSLRLEWVEADLFADSPLKIKTSERKSKLSLLSEVAEIIAATEEELLVISPYFVPGKKGVEFFGQLVEKGVKVTILTNSLASNDVSIVHGGYAKYRRKLLEAGVELYELNVKAGIKKRKVFGMKRSSLHAKTFTMDREKVFVGSLNLDPRSVYENTEIGVLFISPYYGEMISEGVHESLLQHAFRVELYEKNGYHGLQWTTIENGKLLHFTSEPYTSFWTRMTVRFLSIFPFESQL